MSGTGLCAALQWNKVSKSESTAFCLYHLPADFELAGLRVPKFSVFTSFFLKNRGVFSLLKALGGLKKGGFEKIAKNTKKNLTIAGEGGSL
jgi:hypothetical protein